ncbi:MAG: hypothetical protein LHW51_11140 [Candidatus Cloacimonetes bacterium]|nr:hypothetical protein [Candidatus Cloacimonadota bacterium]
MIAIWSTNHKVHNVVLIYLYANDVATGAVSAPNRLIPNEIALGVKLDDCWHKSPTNIIEETCIPKYH